ncbi:MAG: phosphate regulon sensor histidine kinase PhoR [Thiomicrorhabdus sp.]|nr:phosphate regulon sensor histidine kinase PhoR [Thiomicrorhabdus sp.]
MSNSLVSRAIYRELIWVVLSLGVFLFFAWLTGYWAAILILYLALYIVRQVWSLYQFEAWLHGDSDAVAPSSGFWQVLCFFISRQRRTLERRAELQNSKSEQFHAASMALPIAIVSLTKNHKIEWFNNAAQTLLSIKPSDTGRKLETLVRQPEFIQYLKQKEFEKPLFLEAFMGQTRTYRCEIFDYYHGHRLLILEDVHELYNLAKIRKDFVANASHELRTPLTVVNGYLEMMIDMTDQIPDFWEKPLGQMHHQSLRMQAIIEDLLTLSKIESDTLVNAIKVVKVDEILKNIEVDIRYLYSGDYDIHFSIEEGLTLKGVEEPLKSVFTNLISNAFRYTPKGGKISIRWFSDTLGSHFEVEDTGIGISKEHLSRLTERFYRVDTARSRESGGTGLGLAIVKHVLERHDSELKIQSQIGKGSVFRCDFS